MSLSIFISRRVLAVRPTTAHCFKILPQARTIHELPIGRHQCDPPNPVSHGIESYFVDGDDSPPPGNSIYVVDANSDAAESAYEPPSGPWSRAGAETAESQYRIVNNDEAYDAASARANEMPRYARKKMYMEDKNLEISKAEEGTEGIEWRGRKPQGRA